MKISVATGRIDTYKTDGAIILLFEEEKLGKAAERADKSSAG